MKLPLILINFKAYKRGVGNKALKLAKICEKTARKHKTSIAVAVQHADIHKIVKSLRIPVFSQSIDPIEPGAHTGHVLAHAVKVVGASGTLINHSEKNIPLNEIKKCVQITKKIGLVSVCCVPTIEIGKRVGKFKPDFIAFEVPELIGTGRPISKERPDSVKRFVREVSKINRRSIPLCGAGISTGADVKAALELGTKGVLVASAVVKAKNPKKVLREFALATK